MLGWRRPHRREMRWSCRSLVARDDGFEDAFPAVGAVHVSRAKHASLQIAMLVEEKERMVTGAAEVSVPNAVFLLTMRGADA